VEPLVQMVTVTTLDSDVKVPVSVMVVDIEDDVAIEVEAGVTVVEIVVVAFGLEQRAKSATELKTHLFGDKQVPAQVYTTCDHSKVRLS
jgi:hypothetical protein